MAQTVEIMTSQLWLLNYDLFSQFQNVNYWFTYVVARVLVCCC